MICNLRERRAVDWSFGTGILWAAWVSLTLPGCAPGMMRPTVSANAKALWTQWAANEEAAEALRIEQAIRRSLRETSATMRASQSQIAESLGAQRTDVDQLQLELNSLKSLRRETESVTSRTKTLEAETKAHRRDIDQVSALASGLEDKTGRIASDIREMVGQMLEIHPRSAGTAAQVDHLDKEVSQLKNDLRILSDRLGTADARINRFRQSGVDTTKTLDEATAAVSEFHQWVRAMKYGGSLALLLFFGSSGLFSWLLKKVDTAAKKLDTAAKDATWARAAVETIQKPLPQKIHANVTLEPQKKE